MQKIVYTYVNLCYFFNKYYIYVKFSQKGVKYETKTNINRTGHNL